MNQLYYGDNLQVLREHIADESVDLIYLDPPFNSKRDYNLLFKAPKTVAAVYDRRGKNEQDDSAVTDSRYSEAQIEAFEDTWHWNQQAEREFDELLHQPNTDVAEMMKALRGFLGENDMMAYLTMMANRLLQLHRVLKSTGSLYLHCDPTASHYLKIVLDGVFGKQNYCNEIIWQRTSSHNDSKKWMDVHDVIFYYVKSDEAIWNATFTEHDPEYVKEFYRYEDKRGVYRLDHIIRSKTMGPRPNLSYEYKGYKPEWGWRTVREKLEVLDKEDRIQWSNSGRPYLKRYLSEQKGTPIKSVITDIPPVGAIAQERLGYPTQKPLALLERIISSSSDEGDVVLDPFCGCGTAVHAAQKLKRKWIGIDITHLAISLIEKRLKDAFKTGLEFEIHGTPKDLDAARDLANRDKYQFQWWAVSLVDAQPFQGKKKGADTGIDGLKFFRDLPGGTGYQPVAVCNLPTDSARQVAGQHGQVDRATQKSLKPAKESDIHKIVVSVKGGGLKADDVRALNHVREREGADIALFISLDDCTKGMIKDAASAGFYESPNKKKYPRVQLLTIEGLLSKKQRAEHPDYEPDLNFKKAKTEANAAQKELGV